MSVLNNPTKTRFDIIKPPPVACPAGAVAGRQADDAMRAGQTQ